MVTLKTKLKMNTKNIGVIILVIVLIALACYLYWGLTECKTAATELGTQLQECGEALTNLQ